MERLTIRVPEEIKEGLERIQDADDVSQSEAARQLLRRGSEYEEVRAERDRLERVGDRCPNGQDRGERPAPHRTVAAAAGER